MPAFNGPIPGTKPPVPKANPLIDTSKGIAELPVAPLKPPVEVAKKLQVPEGMNEESRLRFRIKDLETKLEIREITIKGLTENDRQYISKMEKLLAAEKAVSRSLMVQMAELMGMMNPDRVGQVQTIQAILDALEQPRPISLTQRYAAAALIRGLLPK